MHEAAQDGDAYRIGVRFAWLPVRCDGGRWWQNWLWWRDYVVTERLFDDYSGASTGIWVVKSLVPLDTLNR